MKKLIDITKKYQTISGSPVKLYAVQTSGCHPVHGAVLNDKDWLAESWQMDGHVYTSGIEHSNDLVEVLPRIQRTIVRWLNVYSCRESMFRTRDAADATAGNRLACIPIEIKIDCEEGEGLDSI